MNQGGTSHPGYEALETHNRVITRKTVLAHQELVETWLTALDFYFETLKASKDLAGPDEDERFSVVTRFAFFSLGVGHSKSALDSTCRGDYHHAFFSIRYMSELIIQGIYLRLRPHEARRWHKRYASKHTADFVPSLDNTFRKVKKALSGDGEAEERMIELVKDCITEADKWGAHPSQEVLTQVMTQSEDRLVLGTRYQRAACISALDRGLLVTLLLIEEMFQGTGSEVDDQLQRRKTLWDERQRLMEPYWEELASARLGEVESGHE